MWWFILLLAPIKKINNEYERSNGRMCLIFALLLIYMILFYEDKIILFKSHMYTSQIITIFIKYSLFGSVLLMLIIFVTNIFNWKKLIIIQQRISKVDDYVNKNGKAKDLMLLDEKFGYKVLIIFITSK